jgi:hypothetical protein
MTHPDLSEDDLVFLGCLRSWTFPVYMEQHWGTYQQALRLARYGLVQISEDGEVCAVSGFCRVAGAAGVHPIPSLPHSA